MLEGKNKSLNEQLLVLESILNKSKKIKEILRVLEQCSKENQDFKNYYNNINWLLICIFYLPAFYKIFLIFH